MQKVVIGPATLYCGDCLELLADGAFKGVGAIISDPPYGISFVKGKGGHGVSDARNMKPIHGDSTPFDPAPWLELAGHKVGNSVRDKSLPVMLFGADYYKISLPGGRFVCWDKSCGQGPAASFVDAEFIWSNRKSPRNIIRHFWMGALRAGEDNQGKSMRRHPAQKPVEVMLACLEYSRVGLGKTVLDPYMGSGTTGVACLRTGRKFVGVEIDEEYFEIACGRIKSEWDKIQEAIRQGVLFGNESEMPEPAHDSHEGATAAL